jgi:hypothetical protein
MLAASAVAMEYLAQQKTVMAYLAVKYVTTYAVCAAAMAIFARLRCAMGNMVLSVVRASISKSKGISRS